MIVDNHNKENDPEDLKKALRKKDGHILSLTGQVEKRKALLEKSHEDIQRMKNQLLVKENEVEVLKSTISNLKYQIRGSDGEIALLRYRIQKPSPQESDRMEACQGCELKSRTDNNTDNEIAKLIHWKKFREVLVELNSQDHDEIDENSSRIFDLSMTLVDIRAPVVSKQESSDVAIESRNAIEMLEKELAAQIEYNKRLENKIMSKVQEIFDAEYQEARKNVEKSIIISQKDSIGTTDDGSLSSSLSSTPETNKMSSCRSDFQDGDILLASSHFDTLSSNPKGSMDANINSILKKGDSSPSPTTETPNLSHVTPAVSVCTNSNKGCTMEPSTPIYFANAIASSSIETNGQIIQDSCSCSSSYSASSTPQITLSKSLPTSPLEILELSKLKASPCLFKSLFNNFPSSGNGSSQLNDPDNHAAIQQMSWTSLAMGPSPTPSLYPQRVKDVDYSCQRIPNIEPVEKENDYWRDRVSPLEVRSVDSSTTPFNFQKTPHFSQPFKAAEISFSGDYLRERNIDFKGSIKKIYGHKTELLVSTPQRFDDPQSLLQEVPSPEVMILSPNSFQIQMDRLKEENNLIRNELEKFRSSLQVRALCTKHAL